jgi:bifunctional DNA-binding transcriptional regulator/antitoxin component of YhaV-PrlF toxin-antitoxin module
MKTNPFWSKFRKMGRSYILILPKKYIEEYNWKNSTISAWIDGKKIIIKKVFPKEEVI